ncbi:Ldh family oxidoreductase [Chromobacterium haemolyticum]|uniref:Ldh family oxidoreductase n=1 Tax=Chromobacterium fluminis TaxID=3044269 RepID=A0ABX0L3C6_9NEIS|nr:Ldh family oxidoreductase [Chromobacterium haemolyticum]NHR05468.1 Ldh family oxidoreductase [Chromobacterium haemolyticum]
MSVDIHVDELRGLVMRTLQGCSVPAALARQVTDDLLENELTGYPSHGVLRLIDLVADIRAGLLDPAARPVVEQTGVNVAIVEGNGAFGVLARQAVADILRSMCREQPLVMVCLRHGHHLGRLAALGRELAGATHQPLAVMGFCNFQGRGQRVAAPGGRLGRLCTNPLLMAFPSDDTDPVVLDMSTTSVSEGYVRRRAQEGIPLPSGCLVGADGRPALTPSLLYADPPLATMQPLGGELAGHKGYGLAVLIELLAGALAGADHVARPGSAGNGGLFLAINPALTPSGLATIKAEAAAIAGHCRETGQAGRMARMPGEGYVERCRVAAGRTLVTLPATTLNTIRHLAGQNKDSLYAE